MKTVSATTTMGKLIGVMLGSLLIRTLGWFGPLLGLWLGHRLDTSIAEWFRSSRTRTHQNAWTPHFIYHSFAIFGAIAKTDTTVKPQSIQAMERFMSSQAFSATQRKAAIAAFQEGKKSNFFLDHSLQQLKLYFVFHAHEKKLFLRGVESLGNAVSPVHMHKVVILNKIHANFSERVYTHQHFHWQQWNPWEHQEQRQPFQQKPKESLSWAYQVLNASANDDLTTITKRYRKLLSTHHPDRLKKPTDSAIKAANEKTHEIKKAYEMIKQHLQ